MAPVSSPTLSAKVTEGRSSDQRIRAAQIHQLYTQSRAGTIGALLSAIILAVVLREVVGYDHLVGWLAVYLALQIVRQTVISSFHRAAPVGDAVLPWGKWFTSTTILSGLLWGLAGIVLIPTGSLAHQFLLALFLSGIAAAGVVVYCPLTECYLPTVVAELIPLSVLYLNKGDEFHVTIGAVILLFGLVLVLTGRHMHELNVESLRLKFDKDDLIGQLKEEIGHRSWAESKLQASEARHRALLDAAPDPVVAYDTGGKATYVNRAFTETYGWSIQEVMGRTIEFVPEEEQQRTDEAWEHTLKGEKYTLETKRFTKDGGVIEIELRTAIICDAMGKYSESIVIHRDVTEHKRAEQRIKESEARYRTLFELASDAIFILEAEGPSAGTIVSANTAAALMHGYSEEELVGLNLTTLADPEEWGRIPLRIDRILNGEWLKEEVPHRRNDGTVFPLEVSAGLLQLGNSKYVLCIGRDITERREAEKAIKEREERYRDLFDNSADLIYTHDLAGNFLSVNLAVTNILGFTPDECLQLHFRDLVDTEFLPLAEEKLRKKIQGGEEKSGPYELRVRNKDGRALWLEINSRIMRKEGRMVAIHGAARDVTERKQAKEDLEHALAVAKDLQMEAELANRAKTEFLANMSHELRTPLNAIIGFSEVLEDQLFGALNETQLKYVGYVVQSGRHLLALINEILDLATVESGKLKLQLGSFLLSRFILNTTVMIKEKARTHDLKMEVMISDEFSDLFVKADELKLRQVVFNLLSNAVKFTPDGGRVTVQVTRVGSNLRISVSDTGIGLNPEDKDRIFEPFEQVDTSLARQQQGAGLGLALTKRLVELHGGSIWVESDGLDRGSSFVVSIPLIMASSAAEASQSLSTRSGGGQGEFPTMGEEQLEDSWITFRVMETRDPSTGLWNLAAIRGSLRREMDRSSRQGASLGVIAVKVYSSDEVIAQSECEFENTAMIEVSKRIASLVRPYDAVGRVGSAEFLIIVPGSSKLETERAALRLRRSFAENPVASEDGNRVFNPRFGVVEVDIGTDSDPERVIRLAFDDLELSREKGQDDPDIL